jgi:hypothetical protein
MYILPNKIHIDNKDENFFLNYEITKKSVRDNNNLLNKIFKLKKIWRTLDYKNKNIIIEYLQLLCIYSEEYFKYIDNNNNAC